jgi:flagellar basal body-associated protein FliL
MIEPGTPLPYPGLRAFERNESHLFFGRDTDIDALIDRLANTRFLSVTGASGSGKSSLVRTGLLAALELGHFVRAGSHWHIVETHPGGEPFLNLARGLNASLDDEQRMPDAILRELLTQGPLSVAEWFAAQDWPANTNLLILVDQFEELFRYSDYAAREEAEAFATLLIESARAAHVPVHIVITMRSEFLGACALLPGLTEEINRGLYLTPRMGRSECREAIIGPARRMGFTVEDDLVNQILNDLAMFAPWEQDLTGSQGQLLSRRADQLPLMQHLLNRLWLQAEDGDNGSKRLTLASYRATGGLEGALDAHGGQVLASLSEADRPLVEPLFRALVSGPDPTTAVRRPARFDELAGNIGGNTAAARRIIDAFRAPDCNFLRPDISLPLADDTLIDIGHESLIRQWAKLNEWTQAEARSETNWQRLVQAQKLHAAGEGDLLTGLNLDTLATWWDGQQPNATWAKRHGGGFGAASAFFEESRAQRDKLQAEESGKRLWSWRRLQATVAVMAVLLAVTGGALTFFFKTSEELEDARIEIQSAKEQTKRADNLARYAAAQNAAANTAADLARRAQISLISDRERQETELAEKTAQIERSTREIETREIEIRRVMSIVENRGNLRALINYCRSHSNEQACLVLYPDGRTGNVRRSDQ